MRHLVSLLLLVTVSGCSHAPSKDGVPQSRARFEWDVSKDRNAAAYPWFDFDLDYGAIDRPAHIVFTFDRRREFEGDTELITFSRANDRATVLQAFHVNLPPQTSSEVVRTLKALASSWQLDTKRLERVTELILASPEFRGVVLSEHSSPTIDVSVHSSFTVGRPYSISIDWSWPEIP